MSKRRKNKNRRKSAKRKNKPSTSKSTKAEKASLSKKWSVKKTISIVIGLVGLVSAIFGIWTALTPRVLVQPGVALDPNKPAFTTFTVQNQGYVPVYDVKLANSFKYLGYPGNTHVIGLGDYTNRFSDPKQIVSKLSPGKEYAEPLALSGLKNNNFQNADIAIVLTYKWIWQRQSLYRFVSKQGKDGKWHWLPRPIKK